MSEAIDYEAIADRLENWISVDNAHAGAAALRQAAQDTADLQGQVAYAIDRELELKARIEALERVAEAARSHAKAEGWPSKVVNAEQRRHLTGGTALPLIDALAAVRPSEPE